MKIQVLRSLAATLALACSFGCASNAHYQQALAERDAEIKALREERTAVKHKNRDLSAQNQVLDKQLQEAHARLVSQPAREIGGPEFPDLDREGVEYGMRDGNMVLTVSSDVTFASGKAELSEKGRKALAAVAKALSTQYPDDEYWIEGHTDSDPIQKSKFDSNRDLSLARAMAVLRYLVEDAGVPDGRCVVAGWGEYRPVAQNDSKGGKAKNRRVEIVVHVD